MENIVIKDFDRLKEILEDTENPVLRKIYSEYVGRVEMAEVRVRRHSGGCVIEGMPGRWWVYVRIRGTRGGYDLALWKVLKKGWSLLSDVVEVVDEPRSVHV